MVVPSKSRANLGVDLRDDAMNLSFFALAEEEPQFQIGGLLPVYIRAWNLYYSTRLRPG